MKSHRAFLVAAILWLSPAHAADLAAILAAPNGSGVIRIPAGTTVNAPVTIGPDITVLFEPGDYTFANKISIQGSGVNFGGLGSPYYAVRFIWAGDNTDCAIEITHTQYSYFHDFGILATSAHPLQCGIKAIDATPAGTVSTQNFFERISIGGSVSGDLSYGMRFGVGATGNNDLHTLIDVKIAGYTEAGFSLEGPQVKGLAFWNCGANSNAVGKYGITTAAGAGSTGGSFSAYNFSGGSNSVADFNLGAPADTILISGGQLEGSARLLQTSGASANGWPVTVQNMRWAGDNLNADNKAIIYQHRGTLTLINNVFESSAALELSLEPTTTGAGVAIGNNVGSTLTDPFTASASGVWAKIGNMLRGGSGSTPIANAYPP